MAAVEAVPELADGGFWYHVNKEITVWRETGETYLDEFGQTQNEVAEVVIAFGDLLPGEVYATRPVVPATSGWCAWYMDDGTVVVRLPEPVTGVDTVSLSTADKLIASGEATRPFGRVGGR